MPTVPKKKPTPKKAVKTASKVAKKGAASTKASNTTKCEYYALQNTQRAKTSDLKFYLFHAPASEIFRWGLVDRTSEENPRAIQRSLNLTKVRKIREFLDYSDSVNTIATSVVVVFRNQSVKFTPTKLKSGATAEDRGSIEISFGAKSPAGVIVDGQHRVHGSFEHWQKTQEDIHLNVVGIVGADDLEGAFQFLVINNNSSKVNPSHVKALFTSYREEDLLKRMLDSGSTNVDAVKITALDYFDGGVDSPFKQQLKWARNNKGFIVPNALEAGLNEVHNRNHLLGIEGDELELDTFSGIWSTIKATWPALWNAESHLLEKAIVQAVTAYICDGLVAFCSFDSEAVDYRDPDVLARDVKKVLAKIEPDFFEVEWAKTGLDTRAGHELLLGDLKQMTRNLKEKAPWHSKLETVKVGAVSGGKTTKGARPKKI